MLYIRVNGIDITNAVRNKSIRVTEQLSSRANTAAFTVDAAVVPKGARVEIWEVLDIVAVAGQDIAVADTFPVEGKYGAGDILRVDIAGATPYNRAITAVNHATKTITMSGSIAGVGSLTKIGRLLFAGLTLKNPDEEIGVTGTFSYKVTASDWSRLLDAKVVAETFLAQYPREIVGRVVYEYAAADTLLSLDRFEGAWAASGTALAMTADAADRIDGLNSQRTGTSGAGTALWSKTIGAANLAALDKIRLWHKIDAAQAGKITALKIRAGTDVANYFEWGSIWTSAGETGLWNYEAFSFENATTTGAPARSSIVYLAIAVTTTAALPSSSLRFDDMHATAGGFTLQSTARGPVKFSDFRVQQKKTTVVMERIAKTQSLFWYVDYERDIHFFDGAAGAVGFTITDTSQNYGELTITADISQLKNRQAVRGAAAPDTSLYTQTFLCNGFNEFWDLDYGMKGLRVFVDAGNTGTFVEKTVGVENLADPLTVEYLSNFTDKKVKKSTDTLVPAGGKIRFVYFPYRPIRVRVADSASIAAIKTLLGGDGIFDGATITDLSIADWGTARMRAQAEVNTYANPIVTVAFETEQDRIRAGSLVSVTDSSRGLSGALYLVQKVTRGQRAFDRWLYKIECASTLFGITEFFQLLLAKSDPLEVDAEDEVDIILSADEAIILTDSIIASGRTRPWYVHGRNAPYNGALTLTEGGTVQDGYANYCEAA